MRRFAIAAIIALVGATAALLIPGVRQPLRAIIRSEPPPAITPLAVSTPAPRVAVRPTSTPTVRPANTPVSERATVAPARTAAPTPPTITPLPTLVLSPTPIPSPTPVTINGRVYDAYIAAASKEAQAYQYSCEFDAAWVILQTYGVDAPMDDLIALLPADTSVEPYIEETRNGFLVHGGDITRAYSGNYRENFLARSTGQAMNVVFAHYGLKTQPVSERAGVEAALRAGQLVWMKTTVDFKPWRPATWVMPDGRTHQTVLGNDHAVVAMGFNAESVVIRDVLGPTSSNWKRPYEYEVRWETFLAAWGAQSFDGIAVAPPAP